MSRRRPRTAVTGVEESERQLDEIQDSDRDDGPFVYPEAGQEGTNLLDGRGQCAQWSFGLGETGLKGEVKGIEAHRDARSAPFPIPDDETVAGSTNVPRRPVPVPVAELEFLIRPLLVDQGQCRSHGCRVPEPSAPTQGGSIR